VQHGADRGMQVCKLAVRGTQDRDHTRRPGQWARRSTLITASVLAVLLACAPFVGARSAGARAWFWSTMLLATSVGVLGAGRLLRRRPAEWLRVVGDQVILQTGPRSEALIDVGHPIGVTLLANAARDRLLVAVTARERAAYFAATIDPVTRSTHRELLARANTVSDDEVLGSPFNEGAPVELFSRDLLTLLEVLSARDARCFERCFLSDTRGRPVILDGSELSVGPHRFDLHAPLEWRATVFQEPFGTSVLGENDRQPGSSGGVMVYQGTWLEQGTTQVVLVSLLASLTSATAPASQGTELASLLARDLRLMQASPEEPPPRDVRVGIERVFTLRLRAAVDRAPRANRADRPSGASMR
jgi:hypothetical protein